MRRKQGFTLPEMIVVLLLITLLFSFAVPSLIDSWHQAQLDFAIQQLHRDIRWAQREAVRTQHRMVLIFYNDVEPYRYVVRYDGNPKNLRRRELPIGLSMPKMKRIFINVDKSFDKNTHILLQRGEHNRYVYLYQTGRTRITKIPTSTS